MGDDDCCCCCCDGDCCDCCCCCCDGGCCDCSCNCCDSDSSGGGSSSFSPGSGGPPAIQMPNINVNINVEKPSMPSVSDSDGDDEDDEGEDDDEEDDSSSSSDDEERLDPIMSILLDTPPPSWFFEGNPCPGHQFGTGGYYGMGANDFLTSPTDLPSKNKSRSLMFDLKATDGSPGWCPLVSYGNFGNVHSFFSVGINWTDRTTGEIVFADGTRKLTKSKIKVTPGHWIRICVSYERKRRMIRFFTMTQPNNHHSAPFRTKSKKQGKLNTVMDRLVIGSHNGPNMLPYIGHIRRVLFFDTALDISKKEHSIHFYDNFPAY